MKLPHPLSLHGDLAKDVALLLQYFQQDFASGSCLFEGCPVLVDTSIASGTTYPKSFMHLITRSVSPGSEERSYCVDRAARIEWPRHTIQNSGDSDVKRFDFDDGHDKGIRTYLWIPSKNYVTILQKKNKKQFDGSNKRVAYLVTSYNLDPEGIVRIQRKFDEKE